MDLHDFINIAIRTGRRVTAMECWACKIHKDKLSCVTCDDTGSVVLNDYDISMMGFVCGEAITMAVVCRDRGDYDGMNIVLDQSMRYLQRAREYNMSVAEKEGRVQESIDTMAKLFSTAKEEVQASEERSSRGSVVLSEGTSQLSKDELRELGLLEDEEETP